MFKISKISKVIFVVTLVISFMWSFSVNAAVCKADNLKVVDVFQFEDGSIFLDFDKPIGCGCSIDTRAAFHKNDNEKFLMSLALTALVTGKSVLIWADNANLTCPIHGNTARLTTLLLKAN